MTDTHQQTLPEGGKARRVYLLLRDDILSGAVSAGAMLAGEQRLAETHAVSRVTIRRALDALEADGLIDRKAGSGTRVLGPAQGQTMAADMATLIPQIVKMGEHSARLLSFSYGVAPDHVADAMGLAANDRVQRAVRVRLAADQAFSHLTTFVPEDIAAHYSEADLANAPLYQLLERSGVRVSDATQRVGATLAGPEVAEALGISVGSALISLRRLVRDSEGRVVEYLAALYRPDLFELEMSLSRVGETSGRHWKPVIATTGGSA